MIYFYLVIDFKLIKYSNSNKVYSSLMTLAIVAADNFK